MLRDQKYLDAARGAASWIDQYSQPLEVGVGWLSDPEAPNSIADDLYSGGAGVVAFLLELYQVTHDSYFLDRAEQGGQYLVQRVGDQESSGLYDGVAGVGFALTELFKVTREEIFLRGARSAILELCGRAEDVGSGVEWQLQVANPRSSKGKTILTMTDLVSGAAGIGLYLLHAVRAGVDEEALTLAVKAGKRLCEIGRRNSGEYEWSLRKDFPRRIPNFAHGTAGVVYFLASLFMMTGKSEFMDAALGGARFLKRVARTNGDICLIQATLPSRDQFVRAPSGYSLGWCNGPAGTGLTWYRLAQATGESEWIDWLQRSARALIPGRIPESFGTRVRRVDPPGSWESFCQCHGTAGNSSFLLNVYQVTGEREFRDVAFRMIDDLLSKADRDEVGLSWPQDGRRWNERRNMLEEQFFPQTGFATGASGIGLALLHFDAFTSSRERVVVFPDSPF